jgi:putative glycosyltransferase (TIGR04348 family)
MRIALITPAFKHKLSGNEITARRYARIFRSLGHRADLSHDYTGTRCDLMVALHARRSFDSMYRFRQLHSDLPLILVFTGTDLYRDIRRSSRARMAMRMADRLVVLQRMALQEIPDDLRTIVSVIHQSAQGMRRPPLPPARVFRICVAGHLRPEKDPFRAAMAARALPEDSRIRIDHVGAALSPRMRLMARRYEQRSPHYRWLGERSHWQTRRIIAGSHLLVITSRIEGNSNALCEALALSIPVIASRIAGNMGTLGNEFPGYFPVGDTRGLAELLSRCESDAGFHRTLKAGCVEVAHQVDPAREAESWRILIDQFARTGRELLVRRPVAAPGERHS